MNWLTTRPRLWQWEHRVKLLLLARLSYAFLLSLLILPNEPVRLWLLRNFCHRTGQHCRHAHAPLSRLRSALSRMSQQHPPNFGAIGQGSPPPRPWVTVTQVAAGELLPLSAESLRLASTAQPSALHAPSFPSAGLAQAGEGACAS